MTRPENKFDTSSDVIEAVRISIIVQGVLVLAFFVMLAAIVGFH